MSEETLCPKCSQPLVVGEWPFCPHGIGSSNAISDSIPGGIEIRHGICNEDGTPHRYYYKSDMIKEAKRRGVTNIDTHVTDPRSGSDKNKHTKPWF